MLIWKIAVVVEVVVVVVLAAGIAALVVNISKLHSRRSDSVLAD